MRNRLKRGVAIEYALIVMLIVVAFTLVILMTSRMSINNASEYNDYITQKTELDEIGSLCRVYYCDNTGDITDIQNTVSTDYGYTLSYDNARTALTANDTAKVTVAGSNSRVYLTMIFSCDGADITLARYVYGDI